MRWNIDHGSHKSSLSILLTHTHTENTWRSERRHVLSLCHRHVHTRCTALYPVTPCMHGVTVQTQKCKTSLKTQICKLWHTNKIKTRLRNANIHRCTFPCCHTDLAWPFMHSHHVSQELPEHPVTQPRGLMETAFATKPSWLASTPCPTPRETRCAGTPWWNLKYAALHCHICSPLSSQLKLLLKMCQQGLLWFGIIFTDLLTESTMDINFSILQGYQ